MFTGRKYSAQAGWEYILRQMKEEFPTIMADVHYRVLKKKWSNLLQQYKELKNPVHGDKNRADDISWPFYAAIDEVIGNLNLPSRRHGNFNNGHGVGEEEDEEDVDRENDLNPQEFLCLSVTPEEEDGDIQCVVDRVPEVPRFEPIRQEHRRGSETVFDIDKNSRLTRRSRKRKSNEELLSRLPCATELTIRPIQRTNVDQQLMQQRVNGTDVTKSFKLNKHDRRTIDDDLESRIEKKIVEFMDYVRMRDEENRNILVRMLAAVEDIRNAVR